MTGVPKRDQVLPKKGPVFLSIVTSRIISRTGADKNGIETLKNETASNFRARLASHCLLTGQGEQRTTISGKIAAN